MKIIILIFVMLSLPAFSADNDLTCSLRGTELVYVNGVDNTKNETIRSRKHLEKNLKDLEKNIDRIGIVGYDYSYNHSSGLIKDLLESLAQATEAESGGLISFEAAYVILFRLLYHLAEEDLAFSEKFHDQHVEILTNLTQEQNDIADIKKKIKENLDANKKVILVSHSQGNFLVNRALNNDFIDDLDIIGNVRIATPQAEAFAKHSEYVLNGGDIIRLFPLAPYPNFVSWYQPSGSHDVRDPVDRKLNHSFMQTYMFDLVREPLSPHYNENIALRNLRLFTLNTIIDVAEMLDPHPRCPRAVINYSFNDSNNRLSVNFDSTDPDDPTIDGLMYIWDFGDFVIEGPISSKTISHIYPEEGTYTVKLRVTDAENNDFGEQATSEATITVGASILGCYGYEKGNYHLNPDGTLGGFVANTASVSSTVTVPVTVSICGTSQILGSTSLSPATDSYIFGEVIIRNSTLLDTSIEGAWYMVLDSIVSNSSFKNGATLESSDINRLTVASGTHIRKSTVSDVNYSNPDGGFFFDDSNVKNFVTNARITVERSEILNTTYLVADPVKTLGVRLTGSNIINCAINGIVGNYPYIEYANLTGIAGTFIRLDISLGTTSAINQVGFPDWSGESYLNYPYWQSI